MTRRESQPHIVHLGILSIIGTVNIVGRMVPGLRYHIGQCLVPVLSRVSLVYSVRMDGWWQIPGSNVV